MAVAQARTVSSAGWQEGLLAAIGAPATSENVQALTLWAGSEGVAPKNNNWLAITDPQHNWPHSGVVAPNGNNPVYAFPSQSVGIEATASFLQHGYLNVVSALRNNIGLPGIYSAINHSRWCAGCQNGKYPVQLSQAVNGGVTGTPPSTGSDSNPPPVTDPDNAPCLWKLPKLKLPGPVPDVGGGCVLYESQGRAVLGVVCLVGGGLIMLTGLALLVGLDKNVLQAVGSFSPAGKVVSAAREPVRSPEQARQERFDEIFEERSRQSEQDRAAQRQRARKAFRGNSVSIDDV